MGLILGADPLAASIAAHEQANHDRVQLSALVAQVAAPLFMCYVSGACAARPDLTEPEINDMKRAVAKGACDDAVLLLQTAGFPVQTKETPSD